MARAKKNKRTIKPKIILLLILLLIIGGVVFLLVSQNSDPKSPKEKSSTASKDLARAEKEDVDQHKANLPSEKDANPSQSGEPSTPNGSSTVTISYAEQTGQTVQVSSYVSGVFEDGGTCTLTLTKGTKTVTRTATGLADATHTTCPTFNIDNTNHAVLSAGAWKAIVSYSSATHSGTSESKTLEAQ